MKASKKKGGGVLRGQHGQGAKAAIRFGVESRQAAGEGVKPGDVAGCNDGPQSVVDGFHGRIIDMFSRRRASM